MDFQVFNDEGRPFLVRVLEAGDAYGRDNVLSAESRLIEFWDLGGIPFLAQRYYADTLVKGFCGIGGRGMLENRGLALDVGNRISLDGSAMKQVFRFLDFVDSRKAATS